jgi:hypothetical protein
LRTQIYISRKVNIFSDLDAKELIQEYRSFHFMPNEFGRIRVNFIFVCRRGFNPEHTGEFTFVGDMQQ